MAESTWFCAFRRDSNASLKKSRDRANRSDSNFTFKISSDRSRSILRIVARSLTLSLSKRLLFSSFVRTIFVSRFNDLISTALSFSSFSILHWSSSFDDCLRRALVDLRVRKSRKHATRLFEGEVDALSLGGEDAANSSGVGSVLQSSKSSSWSTFLISATVSAAPRRSETTSVARALLLRLHDITLLECHRRFGGCDIDAAAVSTFSWAFRFVNFSASARARDA